MSSEKLERSKETQLSSRDPEDQNTGNNDQEVKVSAFKSLGLLDRFLAVWIFLAMLVGILLGNFVPNTGPALQKGTFVGVSIPIGEHDSPTNGGVKLSDSIKPSACSS